MTKVRVSINRQVVNLGESANINVLRKELNNHVYEITQNVNIQDLEDWKLLIGITCRATNGVGFFKRVQRYPSDKEFEVSISVGIPNEEQASYGMEDVKSAYFAPLDDKKFHVLEPLFENYDNLEQYILESAKLGIDLAFTQGFTCNGKRIKFKSSRIK